jgi:hypothetical protein
LNFLKRLGAETFAVTNQLEYLFAPSDEIFLISALAFDHFSVIIVEIYLKSIGL